MLFPSVRFSLRIVEECASTQAPLRELRGTPDFHASVLLALRQTAGYGRRGREWAGASGNLALSFGLEVENDSALPLLTFGCGLALFDTVKPLLPAGADLRLKWPNDLYLDGKKLAGMIAQGRQAPGRGSEVVVGVGLNLRLAPKDVNAIALSQYAAPPAPAEFAVELLTEIEKVFFCVQDFATLRAAWESAARLQEGEVYVLGETTPARAEALLPTGELLLVGGRKLASEEVSLRQARGNSFIRPY
ncbi:MAG: biotin--[acetyl-CoA-carboxylase] ligase [Bdellovibrionota bacterium]